MIQLIHGNNYAKTREEIVDIKKNFARENTQEIVLESTNYEQIKGAIATPNMFGDKNIYAINITECDKDVVINLINYLKKEKVKNDVLFFSQKELTAKNPILITFAESRFDIKNTSDHENKQIFSFLDNLFSKKTTETLKDYRDLVVSGEDSIYLITMISYQARNIAYLKFNSNEKNARFSKFDNLYSQTGIKKLINRVYQTEKSVKTGKTNDEILVFELIENILNGNHN